MERNCSYLTDVLFCPRAIIALVYLNVAVAGFSGLSDEFLPVITLVRGNYEWFVVPIVRTIRRCKGSGGSPVHTPA